MKYFMTKILPLTCILLLTSGDMLKAQTVRYTTETKMKMHSLGAFAGIMGGNKVQESTHYITPEAMRADEGKDESSIVSLADEKMLMLNHKKKNYVEMTFEQMKAYMENARADLEEQMGEARENGLEDAEVSFDMSVEDLGETRDIAGYRAERKLMRMEFTYAGQLSDDQGNSQAFEGNMYTLSDMWVAQGVEGEQVMKQFAENYSQTLGTELMGPNGAMTNMMAALQQGQMGEAMQKMQEEAKKMQGLPLRTNTYVVIVPEGMELDVDAVLNGRAGEDKGKRRRGGLGALARGALKGRGINVGGGGQDAEPEMKEQRVMMETETIYTSIEMVPDDASLFTAPANYKQTEGRGF